LGYKAQDGEQEGQEDGTGPMDLVSEQPAHGLGEAAPDIVLEASGALSVLWRALQHASDGVGTPPCQAWLEILAKSTQQQKGAELGEVRGIAGKHVVAGTQDYP
jgi:hypothetical protein